MANGALILPSYYEAIKDLPDADRLALYDCLVRYGLYGEEIELPLCSDEDSWKIGDVSHGTL